MAEQSKTHLDQIIAELHVIETLADTILAETLVHREEVIGINVSVVRVRKIIIAARKDGLMSQSEGQNIDLAALLAHKPKGFRATLRAMAAVAFMIPMLACSSQALMSRGLTAPTQVAWVQTYVDDPTEPSYDAPIYFFVEDGGMDLLAEYEANNLS